MDLLKLVTKGRRVLIGVLTPILLLLHGAVPSPLFELGGRTWAANDVIWQSASKGLPATGFGVGIALGDVNHDGLADLVACYEAGVRVWINQGGEWNDAGASAGLPTGDKWYSVALGDLNHDGYLDIVAGGAGSGVYAYLGDGAGSWTGSLVTATGAYYDVAIGDVNNDGDPDVVATRHSSTDGGVFVWAGDGSGIKWTSFNAPTSSGLYWGLALGDVNHDGILDIAAAKEDKQKGSVHVWVGDAAGGWYGADAGLPDGVGDWHFVALGDFSNDGQLDIAVSGDGSFGSAGLRTWIGSGTGTWTPAATGLPTSGDHARVALGDLNNDGELDLVGASLDSRGIQAYQGFGDGTWELFPQPTGSDAWWGVALADVDNDGILDLAAASQSDGGLGLWLDGGSGQPTGNWQPATAPAATGTYWSVAVGDVNNDGQLDVAAAGHGEGVHIWAGDGGNGWTDLSYTGRPPATGTYNNVLIADVTGDGKEDIIAASEGNGIDAWSHWMTWDPADSGLPTSGQYKGLAVGHLNHDGWLDLVACGSDLGVRVWAGNAGTSWTSMLSPADSGSYSAVALADLNHDADLDIVAVGSPGIAIWRGDGGASWTSTKPPTTTIGFTDVALGDIDNDGQLDLVAARWPAPSGIHVWMGDGAWGWTPATAPSIPGHYFDLDLGDFDNDGYLDIVAGALSTSYGLRAWAGNGGGKWSEHFQGLPVDDDFHGAVFGHVDHDGLLDILAAHYEDGGVQVWTAAEATPPGGWAEFGPTGWQTTRYPRCHVQVVDVGSGLDVSSADYAYSADGGSSWSSWESARISGTDGVTTAQVITATTVPFAQDSLTTHRNRIRFRVSDLAGNTGTSPVYIVDIDTEWPSNPTILAGDRPTSTWSNDAEVTMAWTGAADSSSGVSGYSYLWNDSPLTVPDRTEDTVNTSVASTIPGDGQDWYFHVRARDVAGNWAIGATHQGPYWLDVSPPTGPTTIHGLLHSPGQWSALDVVTVEWSGAADPNGSGVAGFSYVWDRNRTTMPDAAVDTSLSSANSGHLADGDDWFVHVRAVDQAGNAADNAAHLGPFHIDTEPPGSQVEALDPWQGRPLFSVRWNGDHGSGSPIVGYDVAYKDGAGPWTTWYISTTATSSVFHGERGHTYFFRSRARDAAGNEEAYSSVADAVTTVGRDLPVRVQDESGVNRNGARVYHRGHYVGDTAGDGTLVVPDVLLDDELAALYRVYEQPAQKDHHHLAGDDDWAWHVYQTSIAIVGNGTPTFFEVVDLNVTPVLTVRRDRPLIGLHILVSVEWDASDEYIEDLRTGLLSGSDYLYDLGDGQFFLETIEIYDDRQRWTDADVHIHASNTTWPNATGSVFGIIGGTEKHVRMGRHFDGSSSAVGPWAEPNGFRTLIHELGHYALGLWDEYLDCDGDRGGYCATNFDTTPEERRASFMNYQYTTTEMCSKIDPTHRHHHPNWHSCRTGGQSLWETVQVRFGDSSAPARWDLQSPDNRGAIMPGPSRVAVEDWTDVYTLNADTGVCAPFPVEVGPGAPFPMVWVTGPGPNLYQGTADGSGHITIYGAHDGDILRVYYYGMSTQGEISCSNLRVASPERLALTPDPFAVQLDVTPLTAETLRVGVATTATLVSIPTAHLWQTGATEPITVTLAYSPTLEQYTGVATLIPAHGPHGHVHVVATDEEARQVQALSPFHIASASASEINRLTSDDDNFELILPADSLRDDAVVSIQAATGSGAQGNLLRVSAPYRVALSTGQRELKSSATIHMRYHAEAVTGVLTDTLRIHRWDETTERWVPIGGTLHEMLPIVTAHVDELSTFALLGERSGHSAVYLPLILRQ
jgi:hypothetical protein